MKQIGQLEISWIDTGPLGWKLSTSIAILPAILYNQWHGHELTLGWLRWGITFWWPSKEIRERPDFKRG